MHVNVKGALPEETMEARLDQETMEVLLLKIIMEEVQLVVPVRSLFVLFLL